MGPFIKSNNKTKKIMLNIIIALMPIIIFSVIKSFLNTKTFYPLIFISVATISSLIFETLYSIIILRKKNIKDNCYGIFTGLFLSLIIPLSTPLPLLVLATFISSIFGKMIFGGFAKNKINPSIIGYILIYILSYLKIIELDSTILGNSHFSLALLALLFLILTKTIKWRISLTYILTIFAVNYVVGGVNNLEYPFKEIISSSLLFGATFIITEQVTTPVTPIGQILFGMFTAVISLVIRYLTPFPELELAGILIMNIFTKKIDEKGAIARFNFKAAIIPFVVAWVLILSLSLIISIKYNKEINEIIESNITEQTNEITDPDILEQTEEAENESIIQDNKTVE